MHSPRIVKIYALIESNIQGYTLSCSFSVFSVFCFTISYRSAHNRDTADDDSLPSKLYWASIIILRILYLPYLIFVHSINSGASVKKLTEGNFFHNQPEKDSGQLCTFVHSVLFHTQCVILHTVYNFTCSVWFYSQFVILHTVFDLTQSV